MPRSRTTTPRLRALQALTLLLLCTLLLIAAGCRKRAAHAAPPTVNPTPTAEPAPTPAAPPEEKKPETPAETAPAPGSPTMNSAPPGKPAPSKPRPAGSEPAPAEPTPAKPAPPQISPRLSPEEQASAERRTNEAIGVAERNLQVVYGKQLNSVQHDLVEKIRGFLGQAHEAMRASDWVRARNLAQKAQVLSVELVNSF